MADIKRRLNQIENSLAGSPIAASDAQIKTCSVEIRALVIGKKQMTLSVFRQLPSRHIIEPGVGLRGEPWGLVNYFWDGCGESEKHLHVVHVMDGSLFRCCLSRLSASKHGVSPRNRSDELEAYGDATGLRYIDAAWTVDSYGPYYGLGRLGMVDIQSKIEWWNGVYDKLAALEQLFIAV